tara:strand:+ start:122 stop:508 length:387 start_codon:yes stop_codon:yes gene_type:complete
MKRATSGDFIEMIRNDNIPFTYKKNEKIARAVQGKGIFNSFYGKKHTEESKALMLRFGPKHSDEFKENLSKRMKDNKYYVANIGSKRSDETKAKIKAKRAIQVITDEHRASMSKAQKERWRIRKLKEI